MNSTLEEKHDDPEDHPARPPKPRRRDIFDIVSFGIGAYGFLHEVLAGATDARWGILVMSGVLMGMGKSLDVLVRILEIMSNRENHR